MSAFLRYRLSLVKENRQSAILILVFFLLLAIGFGASFLHSPTELSTKASDQELQSLQWNLANLDDKYQSGGMAKEVYDANVALNRFLLNSDTTYACYWDCVSVLANVPVFSLFGLLLLRLHPTASFYVGFVFSYLFLGGDFSSGRIKLLWAGKKSRDEVYAGTSTLGWFSGTLVLLAISLQLLLLAIPVWNVPTLHWLGSDVYSLPFVLGLLFSLLSGLVLFSFSYFLSSLLFLKTRNVIGSMIIPGVVLLLWCCYGLSFDSQQELYRAERLIAYFPLAGIANLRGGYFATPEWIALLLHAVVSILLARRFRRVYGKADL